ncbi:50S ribosomal protein L16 [candidate division WWE3 bacterium RIFCSPHIGHO2_01_FULL_40_23]|uniref:Large ribosomal subunit protein uL16 n=1 Tax=candidate division WWE3 bacterium RIFCSPLOWO2_01_FULL_41_18 TaxID=1802625 RepID=A0A1F4VDB8_UNCKA|nr:MAG: 50S ribosomal protein L16 [candidate division WWE3 bacterium RIFCSPHIGHO2_01_FULL_40_23]OGC55165.1 MAG: 50S ribosomal protein L16 [candidate division WWE3 bacterium RIFCSPLOWO2_01_FULL_41_18]
MLMPKKTKYRKQQTGKMRGVSGRGNSLEFGEYGLKALGRGYITSRQIEAARKAIAHYTKRGGRLWIRIFPAKPITKKPNETRMGSGKGAVDHYAVLVLPGRVLLEMSGVTKEMAGQALLRASHKLPLKTRFLMEK